MTTTRDHEENLSGIREDKVASLKSIRSAFMPFCQIQYVGAPGLKARALVQGPGRRSTGQDWTLEISLEAHLALNFCSPVMALVAVQVVVCSSRLSVQIIGLHLLEMPLFVGFLQSLSRRLYLFGTCQA